MSDRRYWGNELTKSKNMFAATELAQESSRAIFSNVMTDLGMNSSVQAFDASVYRVDNQKKVSRPPVRKSGGQGRSKGKKQPPLQGISVGIIAILLVLLLVFIINTKRKPKAIPVNKEGYNPPLTIEDLPEELAENSGEYKTIATNNEFYLGYKAKTGEDNTKKILVHSRAGKIDWDSLYAVNADNDLVTNITVDKEQGVILLPESESDISIEIADDKGNKIKCIIPTEKSIDG